MSSIASFSIQMLFLCASAGTLLAQAAVLTSVQNPASNIPAGLPNSGLAQGSLIVVYGSNLGLATLVQASSVPWPTTAGLAGTTITVTVNGTTVTAPMDYTYVSQVAAILPSNTPLGNGTLTVKYNGATGSIPITVVASNFGMSTVNQTGTGPAVVTFPDYSLVTTSNSAKPGDVVVLWGTGLGATTGSDAAYPVQVDLGTPIQLSVGGTPATVLYRGRSALPGLDQINFKIPSGVSGCNLSLNAFTGSSIVSNYTSISVATNGGQCSDPTGALAFLTGLLTKSSIRFGLLGLEFTDNNGGVAGVDTLIVQSTFMVLSQRQFAATAAVLTGQVGTGLTPGCSVSYAPLDLTPLGVSKYLTAGAALTLTNPLGAATTLLPDTSHSPTGVYGAILTAEPAGTYTFSNGVGASDVGPFNVSFTLAPPVTWTNSASAAIIDRSKPLTITWTGGDSTAYVDIALGGNSQGTNVNIDCSAPASLGQLTIPPGVLYALPAVTGDLTVATGTYGQQLPIPGFDLFSVYAARPATSIQPVIR